MPELVARSFVMSGPECSLPVHLPSLEVTEVPISAIFRIQIIDPSGDAARLRQLVGDSAAIGQVVDRLDHRAVRLSPREWLVMAAIAHETRLFVELCRAAGDDAAVTTLSDSFLVLAVTGTHALDLLAKGCSADLQRLLGAGAFWCGRFADLPAKIERHQGRYLIYIDRSYAQYLSQWLIDATREFSGSRCS